MLHWKRQTLHLADSGGGGGGGVMRASRSRGGCQARYTLEQPFYFMPNFRSVIFLVADDVEIRASAKPIHRSGWLLADWLRRAYWYRTGSTLQLEVVIAQSGIGAPLAGVRAKCDLIVKDGQPKQVGRWSAGEAGQAQLFQTDPIYAAGTGEYRFDLTVEYGDERDEYPDYIGAETIADMTVLAKDNVTLRMLAGFCALMVTLLGVIFARVINAPPAPATVNVIAPSAASANARRVLGPSDITLIANGISAHPGQKVTLEALTGDLEANNLATQLADAFSQAKWNVTMTSVIVAGSPPVGIQIEVPG